MSRRARKARARRKRRVEAARLRHGDDAAPSHRLAAGRTGRVHQKRQQGLDDRAKLMAKRKEGTADPE